ncbi:MAG: acyltransferase [Bacteroidales bacterium]|nr:acyltransferase [Bacteroidales bacterium]
MNTSKKREAWIDTIKSICIICVYIAHCESFYFPAKDVATFIVTPFYVNTFFFINGYLLFKKQFKNNRIRNYTLKVEYKKDLCNILFRLAIPTIIFSAIIYIPKNHGNFDFDRFIYNIFGGTSFWFTSAICVSQITIYTLLLRKRKNIWFYVSCTLLITVITTKFGDVRSKTAEEYFP